MLIIAKSLDFDVFNALNAMDNPEMFKELRFGIGDGNLQFYLYNWGCESMPSQKVGLILV
jgi:glycylpeptide N-tetradecanoyltransferase